MTAIAILLIIVIGGFIWSCVRETSNTTKAVDRLKVNLGLSPDAEFFCSSGKLLFDFSGRKVGLAYVSFPTKFRPPDDRITSSAVIDFDEIAELSAGKGPGETFVTVRLDLKNPNMINGEKFISLYVMARDDGDRAKIQDALARVDLKQTLEEHLES